MALSLQRKRFGFVITLVMLLMTLVFLAPLSLVFIGPGHGGVLWRRFHGGTAFGPALGEGFHIILPWNHVSIYDLRLQTWNDTLYALSSDGLSLSIGVTVRYRLSPDNLAFLQDSVGPDYVAKVIEPQVGATVRQLVALYPMESLLGPLRNQIQEAIYKALTDRSRLNEMAALNDFTGGDANQLKPLPIESAGPMTASTWGRVNTRVNTINRPLILLQDMLINRIVIPEPVRQAINEKLQQSERVQEYAYRLAVERYQAELKVIEAEGIRRFENTVAPGITKGYLELRGIEATEALAKSPNAKIIVIGGKNGLPLILNTGDGGGSLDTTTPTASLPEQNPPVVQPELPPVKPKLPPKIVPLPSHALPTDVPPTHAPLTHASPADVPPTPAHP